MAKLDTTKVTRITSRTWEKRFWPKGLDGVNPPEIDLTEARTDAGHQKLCDLDQKRLLWTLVDAPDGNGYCLTSGYHRVNRDRYIVAEHPYEEGAVYDVIGKYGWY